MADFFQGLLLSFIPLFVALDPIGVLPFVVSPITPFVVSPSNHARIETVHPSTSLS